MRMLGLTLLLLAAPMGCRRPEIAPPPAPVQLTIHFLDRDAILGLAAPMGAEGWQFMDAGLWRPLEVRWKPGGTRGTAVAPRTAPDWVLLQDPNGEIHRIILRDDPDSDPSPRAARMDPDERDWLTTLGLLWVLQWVRR